ncbi:MAG: hypothetical protein ACRELY_11140 [Polyangiaceae bacterium]
MTTERVPSKRGFSFLALAVLVAACGGAIGTVGDAGGSGAADASASDASDAGPLVPVDAGDFCTGSSARMKVNGSEIGVVSTTGKSIVLDCCDSAELTVATSAYQAVFDVLWRVPGGASAVPIDLDAAPPHFQMEIDLGCDPATTSCAGASPEARFAGGFSGSIDVKMGASGESVSYCISVAEDPTMPQAQAHTLMLYAPNVPSGS